MDGFTHLDGNGKAIMVDIGDKDITKREATAAGYIAMSEECLKAIIEGSVPKGDVFAAARIAGIMGAKRTSELIPLCHLLQITSAQVDFHARPERCAVEAICTVRCTGKTGVEMEALTGVSTALLTIYDMCKAIDRAMRIGGIHVVRKSGGRSGDYTAPA